MLFTAFERIDTDHFGRLTVQITHENDEENILACFSIVIAIISHCRLGAVVVISVQIVLNALCACFFFFFTNRNQWPVSVI